MCQWAVCHRKAMQREKHGAGVRRQVHQEAAEHGQLARGAAGGDRAGGGHPAADSAPQHRHAARRLREPHRCGAHPAAVSVPETQMRGNIVKDSILYHYVQWMRVK